MTSSASRVCGTGRQSFSLLPVPLPPAPFAPPPSSSSSIASVPSLTGGAAAAIKILSDEHCPTRASTPLPLRRWCGLTRAVGGLRRPGPVPSDRPPWWHLRARVRAHGARKFSREWPQARCHRGARVVGHVSAPSPGGVSPARSNFHMYCLLPAPPPPPPPSSVPGTREEPRTGPASSGGPW